MTLIKSLLLGSAAGIVAIASAQAADLPTKKGAPAAEYVKVCSITVAGKPVVGFTIPGSDTCIKLSGYITGQIEGGNLQTAQTYYYADGWQIGDADNKNRNSFGYTTRLNFAADVVSNTAYGPLAGHLEMQFENGNGFDNTGTGAYINLAYVTWAGITAGKAPSFFSFTGGGAGWANFFSPDQQGFNQPDVLAYTASFGGGFSASLALQSPGTNGNSGGGTRYDDTGLLSFGGLQAPDVVANIKVAQGWGSAQLAGVAHQVNATDIPSGATINKWGWALDAGVSFNLPSFGAGDQFLITGAYSQNATWFSGLPDGMWGENGAVNGNGQQMALSDAYFDPAANGGLGAWSTPTAWSISAELDHHFTPEFTASLEGSVGGINWSSTSAYSLIYNSTTWLIGGVAHWDPVKNLDFEFELLYQSSSSSRPNGFVYVPGVSNANWEGGSTGAAARFEITRSW